MRLAALTAQVHDAARAAIAAAAVAAQPCETGGFLLGWWEDSVVVVPFAVEVPDQASTSSSWIRDEVRSQAALESALELYRHPWLGYVGDWHSHPAPCGPSGQDERSIRRASRSYPAPLLLLVRRSDGQLDARAARAGRRTNVVFDPTNEMRTP